MMKQTVYILDEEIRFKIQGRTDEWAMLGLEKLVKEPKSKRINIS